MDLKHISWPRPGATDTDTDEPALLSSTLKPDQSESALDACDVADVLIAFHERGRCTIGEAACLLLGTQNDAGLSWPVSDDMEWAFISLCKHIRESLFSSGAVVQDSGQTKGDVDESQINVVPHLAVASGLERVGEWHARSFLHFWTQRHEATGNWLLNRYPLSGRSASWMTDCQQDVSREAVQGNAADSKYQTKLARAQAETAIYRHLVARMFLAGASKTDGIVTRGWEHLGYTKAVESLIKNLRSFEAAGQLEAAMPEAPATDDGLAQISRSIGVDQAKLYVARALQDLLGPSQLERKLGFVHDVLDMAERKRKTRRT